MTHKIKCAIAGLAISLASLQAQAADADGCPAGSYSIVLAPDGATLSILFDKFTLDSPATTVKTCRIAAPLNLPADRSIGVYKVDYRGFAKLGARQETELDVRYLLGPQGPEHGRNFKRKVKGPHEGDYLFSETLGAGQMKRVGCGTAAILNVNITLKLLGDTSAGAAMASLDSTDAAPGAALVYHLDLKQCP